MFTASSSALLLFIPQSWRLSSSGPCIWSTWEECSSTRCRSSVDKVAEFEPWQEPRIYNNKPFIKINIFLDLPPQQPAAPVRRSEFCEFEYKSCEALFQLCRIQITTTYQISSSGNSTLWTTCNNLFRSARWEIQSAGWLKYVLLDLGWN